MERRKSLQNLEEIGGVTYGCCAICGSWEAVERHHIFAGRGMRQLSERYGAVITLCAGCHRLDADSVHRSQETREAVERYGQREVMRKQGWSGKEFLAAFHRNYLRPEELREVEEEILDKREEEEAGFWLLDGPELPW